MNAMNLSRALLAAAALSSGAAGADDVAELAGLLDENVVSTASKAAETAGAAPATTSVITADDLRRHGVTSLDQAIDFLGLGMIAEASWATPEVGARGVLLSRDYGNHVLLLVDGHAVNEPWDGTAYYDRSAGIPLDLVDHVEVILGPGSVLYGSSAMLGVINVVTRRAKDYAGVHVLADAAAPAGLRGAAGYGGETVWGGTKVELTAAVDWARSWGPRAAYGAQPYGDLTWGGRDATHREIDTPAGHLRLVVGDLDVMVRAATSTRTATQILGTFDDPENWERDRWLSLDARWSTSLASRVAVTLRAYGDLYDYLMNTPSAGSDCGEGLATCVARQSGVSRWGGLEASGTVDWLGDGRYVLLVGGDARERHVTSWAGERDPGTGVTAVASAYDRSGAVLGAYLQQTAHPLAWLTLNAGVRLDRDGDLGAHLSPRVAAVVQAWKGGTLKAIYSEAFRAPTFYERFNADGVTWIAPDGLRPETVRSVEASVEQRAGAQRVRVGAFRSWWNDLVLTVPATAAQLDAAHAAGLLDPAATSALTYGNASSVESWGVNADWEGSALARRLRYGAGVTWAHSRQVTDGAETLLPAAAQLFGNARASYELGGRLPVLALALRYVGARPVSATSFAGTPDVSPQVEALAAVTGPLRGGVSYRLSASWGLRDVAPYAVGPVRGPEQGSGTAALLPIPRYQVAVGLRYDR